MPQWNPETEKLWVKALKKGEQSAFENLFHHYKRMVYYGLYKLVHLPQVAEELTQDVFLKIWDKRAELDEHKSFAALLYRISANLAIDFYRKAAADARLREELIKSATIHDDPFNKSNLSEHESLIREALQKLPPRRRRVFELCKLEGKSYHEVATILNISPGTVNDHIVKAVRFLRMELLSKQSELYYLLLLSMACAQQ
ncbi:RNA polymerase sigma-70 factor [Olivibacter sp. SDN3]|uniref:RNA polymerase sigma factor n=1 Tax=Olivibacter sp. SDN3 TaxID=2764720 RepID=UPI0016511639|nr:RNA polymerase sigma-70 factor [Olivibacter sp. SDN3]QNL51670.1 RNA polymerase sigma-70 factor [Olivibacter sp. SDN3]